MPFRRLLLVSFIIIFVSTPSYHHSAFAESSEAPSQFYDISNSIESVQSVLGWIFPSFVTVGLNTYVALSEIKNTSPITVTFGGDVLMEHSLVPAMQKNGALYPFEFVKPIFEDSDYTVINLETPITNATEAFPKIYNFKASPLLLEGLKEAGVDMVSLANNHTLDYKEQGLLDTLEALNTNGIEYVGAGRNKEEAYSEKIISIKGKKVAFLAFSKVLPAVSWYAGEDKPGIASGYQIERAAQIVEETAKKADYVLVYYHWGKEKQNMANSDQKKIAMTLIDHGADAIVGSHPHVLQGFGTYKGKPIAYSLGNFLFPDYVKGPTADNGVLKLSLTEDKIDLAFYPHRLVKNQIIPLTEQDKINQYHYLSTISQEVYLNEDGNLLNVLPVQKNGQ